MELQQLTDSALEDLLETMEFLHKQRSFLSDPVNASVARVDLPIQYPSLIEFLIRNGYVIRHGEYLLYGGPNFLAALCLTRIEYNARHIFESKPSNNTQALPHEGLSLTSGDLRFHKTILTAANSNKRNSKKRKVLELLYENRHTVTSTTNPDEAMGNWKTYSELGVKDEDRTSMSTRLYCRMRTEINNKCPNKVCLAYKYDAGHWYHLLLSVS